MPQTDHVAGPSSIADHPHPFDRYAALTLRDATVIYDRELPLGWVQSNVAHPIAEVR
jgi:hypothetical protein